MLLSLLYFALRRLLRMLTVGGDRDDATRDVELLVLREWTSIPIGGMNRDKCTPREYVREDEYAEFLADPNSFTLNKIFPRMATNLVGLGQRPFPLYWLSNAYLLQAVGGPLLTAPSMRKVLESLHG